MITYLLKSIICSALLLGVYYLVLEREKMHRFNRFYLLSAFIVSWLIPLTAFKVSVPEIAEHIRASVLPATSSYIGTQSSETLVNTGIHSAPVNYLPVILWSVYGIITLALLIRFIMNTYQIRKQIISRKIEKFSDYSLVIIPDNEVSFSFFNYIFPAQSDYANGTMNSDIFLHETVHAKEKHSIDILFIELCKVFLWLNPFVFLYKGAIQLNHEFLADDVVVGQNKDVFNYQSLLLSKITQLPISQLVSTSNYSITKKRFIMMTKRTGRTKSFLLKISTVPILGLLFIFFADKNAGAKNIVFKGPITTYQDTSKNGITQEDFDDYQAVMRKAAFTDKTGKTAIYLNKIGGIKGAEKYYNLYQKMSPEQKKAAIPCVPPPPTNEIKKFSPPKVIKDKKVKRFAPPKIVRDTVVKAFTRPAILKNKSSWDVTPNNVTKNNRIQHEKARGIILITENAGQQNERNSITTDTTINRKEYYKVSVSYPKDSSKNSVRIIRKDSANIFTPY